MTMYIITQNNVPCFIEKESVLWDVLFFMFFFDIHRTCWVQDNLFVFDVCFILFHILKAVTIFSVAGFAFVLFNFNNDL